MPDIKTALINAIGKWDDEPALNKDKAMPQNTHNTTLITMDTPTTPSTAHTTKPQFFKTTTNITRATFEFVRDNPGKMYREVENAMRAKGMNARSVSSLLSQMVQQGLIVKRGGHGAGTYYATTNEYSPIKALATRKKLEAKRIAAEKRDAKKAAASTGIAALKTDATPAPAPVASPEPVKTTSVFLHRTESVETILSRLSIMQARALYDELKKIFGG